MRYMKYMPSKVAEAIAAREEARRLEQKSKKPKKPKTT